MATPVYQFVVDGTTYNLETTDSEVIDFQEELLLQTRPTPAILSDYAQQGTPVCQIRRLRVTIRAVGDSPSALRDMKHVLSTRVWRQGKFYEFADRYLNCYLESVSWRPAPPMVTGRLILSFVAPDPFWYDATESSNSGSGTGSVDLAVAPGDIAIPCVMRITDTSGLGLSNPLTFEDVTNSKSLQVSANVPASGWVEVDFKERTVIDNNGTDLTQYASGDWWFLQPNTTTVRATWSDTNAGDASVKYRKAYL